MTVIVARLILAFVVIAASPVAYFLTYVLLYRSMMDDAALMWSGVLSASLAVSVWLVIWRNVVRWTSHRMVLTAILLAGSVAVTVIGGLMMMGSLLREEELTIIIACMV